MSTVSIEILRSRLSSYLQRVRVGERIIVLDEGNPVAALVPLADLPEQDEERVLAGLAVQGLVILPDQDVSPGFAGPSVPARGKPAADMVIEDRR